MTNLAAMVDALREAGVLIRSPSAAPVVCSVAVDSRLVEPGSLYCAVRGTARDGHTFITDALARGAAAVLVEDQVEHPVPTVVVRDGRAAAAIAAAVWYGWPGRAMTVVGVTGTNGKSTTVSFTRHLLNAGHDVGVLGTLGAYDGAGASIAGWTGLTTPGPVELQATLAAMRDRGCTTVVMEASSHALHQRRLVGLGFRAAVYTNLTHEHLDYHGDLDAYLAAKRLLSAQLVDGGVDVINADDPAWRGPGGRDGTRRMTFGLDPAADVRGSVTGRDATGSDVDIQVSGSCVSVRVPIPGEFNVSNALAAFAASVAVGRDPATVGARLRTAPPVPGRMERLVTAAYTVLRDYAHTPDAYRRVLRTLRPITSGRLIILFGCGGDRDRAKRAIMGEIAGREADLAVVTSDNPRHEDPETILDDIERGLTGVAHLRITDRREAIERAVRMLEPGDCLLLAGKGHETYQIVGNDKQPFDERHIVLSALARTAP